MPLIVYVWTTVVRSSLGCSWRRYVPRLHRPTFGILKLSGHQRLMGATLLVFLNKTDVEHCMTEEEVREVCER